MTGDGTWEAEGLGETGETYLAADDLRMRSASRLLLQDPAAFQEQAIAGGEDPAIAAAAVRTGSTILQQDTNTVAVADALRGQSGTMVATEYLVQEALVAYARLQISGSRWVIVAKIDTAEAFAPVDDFIRNVILATAAVIFLVCMGALVLAQVFTKPLRRLVIGVRQVAAGDLNAESECQVKDEFGDLSNAFNDMSRNLRTEQELLANSRRKMTDCCSR